MCIDHYFFFHVWKTTISGIVIHQNCWIEGLTELVNLRSLPVTIKCDCLFRGTMLPPSSTMYTSVKFCNFVELYLPWFLANHSKSCQYCPFNGNRLSVVLTDVWLTGHVKSWKHTCRCTNATFYFKMTFAQYVMLQRRCWWSVVASNTSSPMEQVILLWFDMFKKK